MEGGKKKTRSIFIYLFIYFLFFIFFIFF